MIVALVDGYHLNRRTLCNPPQPKRVRAMKTVTGASIALLAALVQLGCGDALSAEGQAGCSYGTTSVSSGDENMLPGTACMTCHSNFALAGTVFATATSACAGKGAANAKVEVLDGNGNVAVTLTSNSAGNFFAKSGLPSPYTARVTGPDGTVQQMTTLQTDGSCAHCHREPPTNGAAGRIYLFGNDAGDAGDDGG
jgi:hypothetical protein